MLQKTLSGASLALIFAIAPVHAQDVSTGDASSGGASSSSGSTEITTLSEGGDYAISDDVSVDASGVNSFFLPGGYGYLPEVIIPGSGLYARPPIEFYLNLEQGYNDNIYTSSGTPGSRPKHGSATTQGTIGANILYNSPRTFFSFGGDVGAIYYWDRAGQSTSPVGHLNAVYSHRATDRLSLSARVTSGYYTQPDVLQANNILSNSGDYFRFSGLFDINYRWTPLFSTITTIGGETQAYKESYSDYHNYISYSVGQQFRYLFTPRFTGVVDFRFNQSFYYNDRDRDSTTESALIGFDWLMTPRLTSTLRTGVSFRQYELAGSSDQASPFVEAGVGYRYGEGSILQWTGRYGFEDGNWGYQRTRTLRTGLSVNQRITTRLSGSLGLYYVHEFRDQMLANSPPVDDIQLFDIGARLNYAINRSFTVYGGYNHTQAISDSDIAEYTRNVYTLGLTYRF